MKLREIAHARAGDKGNTCNICVVPYDEAQYPLLKEKLTVDRVRAFFSDICLGEVIRYEADAVSSLNFVLKNALGLHTAVSRVQGGKLKAKAEIRVATVFRNAPEAFLRMIVVHELAHLKEKDHNKAFYQLCCHMEPQYHQLEFDTRLWLTHLSLKSNAQ